MERESLLRPANAPVLPAKRPGPGVASRGETHLSVTKSSDSQVPSHSFEAFLADVEGRVDDAGQALLFTGDRLRLEVTLFRHEKNPRVVWGLKGHEDWAFKATLLRFARGAGPVHFLLSTERNGRHQIRGWVVKRSMDQFWASPLTSEQCQAFWDRCLGSHALHVEE